MSHSVLRRYTPPTCTLEILGKRSPLSRWMAQPALKDLRFRLSLDDPKLSKEEWVELRGDRVQLENLAEAVSSYVQQLLEQPQTSLARIGKASSDTIAVLPQPIEQRAIVKAGQPVGSEIFLRSNGFLNHDLMLGSLANEETDSVVRLSTLQLFDLANALDDYATEIVALPNLQEPRPNWVKSSPAWAQIAAVCLVVVGLSTSVAKLLDHSLISSPTATSQGASSSDQQIANQIPPAAVDNATPPAASNQKLPPPPPLGSTTPGTPGMPKVIVPSTIPTSPGVSNTLPQKPGSPSSKGTGTAADTIALNPGVQRQAPSTFAAPAPAALKPELGDNAVAKRSANSAESNQALSAGSAPQAADSSAFDTMPQVAEARRYFQQRWNPPQGLTQTLEYTLVISPNGSIQQIIPLGQASGDYIDRTNIPLVGEPFVAPIQGGRTARIRLVLSPDGKVQTFLE